MLLSMGSRQIMGPQFKNICIYSPDKDNEWLATYIGLKFPFVGERDGANTWVKAQTNQWMGVSDAKFRAFGLNGGNVSGYCGCS